MDQDQSNPPRESASWLAQSLYARRGVLTSLAILALFVFATQAAWRAYGPSVARSERYRVTPQSVVVTPPPAWVRDHPLRAAFASEETAGGLSILDKSDRLDQRLTAAVESHPWVRRVTSLAKSLPNRIAIEVEYRRPLAAVLTDRGLTPTDADGVPLPARDLNPAFLGRLPKIGIASGDSRRPAPHALSGRSWPADAVAGAAAIVEAFGERFDQLRLIEAQIDPTPDFRAGQRFVTYRLRSAGNTLVIWGAAPGYGPPDEASFAQKLERLKQAINRYGTIGSIKTRIGLIDVRSSVEAFQRVVLREDSGRLAAKPEDPEPASVTK